MVHLEQLGFWASGMSSFLRVLFQFRVSESRVQRCRWAVAPAADLWLCAGVLIALVRRLPSERGRLLPCMLSSELGLRILARFTGMQ